MSGFTRSAARKVIDWSFGASPTAPTTPIKLHLETTAGSDSAAGTDLGSTTWQTLTMGAASNATPPVAANTSSVTITAGASGTVTAQRTFDNSAIDWHWGPLGASRAVVAADQLVFAIGAVTFQLAS